MLCIAGRFVIISLSGQYSGVQINVTNVAGSCTLVTNIYSFGKVACVA